MCVPVVSSPLSCVVSLHQLASLRPGIDPSYRGDFFMTVTSIVFGTKNKPEEKPKSLQRSFIAADAFEFTTELVSYIPANAVSSSAVHFHTPPGSLCQVRQTTY